MMKPLGDTLKPLENTLKPFYLANDFKKNSD